MISGSFGLRNSSLRPPRGREAEPVFEHGGRLVLASRRIFRSEGYLAPPPYEGDRVAVALCGRFDLERAKSAAGTNSGRPGELVAGLYRKHGTLFPSFLDGKFAVAVWDGRRGRLLLARDRFGVEPMFWALDEEDVLHFASSIAVLRRRMGHQGGIDCQAMAKILTFDYNPGKESIFRGISRLGPAGVLVVDEGGEPREEVYWKLEFNADRRPEREIEGELRRRLEAAVGRQVDRNSTPGVFVSGGMDSSTVLHYASQASAGPIPAFSYRCRGETFDESEYARLMAESVSATHHLAEYAPESVELMPRLVAEMDEPFCELGINVASGLLGRASADHADYVLTGDGGDELFGGHPVYEADKVARFIDPIPAFLKWPALMAGRALPDTDKKKDLVVKLKRFSESLMLPKELLSHRWRVYYKPHELQSVLHPDVWENVEEDGIFDDILRINKQADVDDPLHRSIYSDYQTQVDFYIRRNELNRGVGLETRYPLLDLELVEFCATIPSALKIHGWFDTKYIFHNAMDGVLPDGIVHRDDKLGHSIPMKNWLRDEPVVRDFILSYLSEDTLRARGLFRPEAVRVMIKEHLERRRNNSHRLWALATVEMWFQHHLESRHAS